MSFWVSRLENLINLIGPFEEVSVNPARALQTLPAKVGGKGASLLVMGEIFGDLVPPAVVLPIGASVHEPIPFHLIDPCGHSLYESGHLLLSVRSSGEVSMPGMMDTILNVGIRRENLQQFAEEYRTSMDVAHQTLQTFYRTYAKAASEIPSERFDEIHRAAKLLGMSAEKVTDAYEKVLDNANLEIPDDPHELLKRCVELVHYSWHNDRACEYRKAMDLSSLSGTAVIVQKMVFGNLNERSLTGVLFSHNLDTGEREWFGEYLVGAQGEDLVSGERAGRPVSELLEGANQISVVVNELTERLEEMYDGPIDIEFTVENDRLYILQARRAKMSPIAESVYQLENPAGSLAETLKSLLQTTLSGYDGGKPNDTEGGVLKVASGFPVGSGKITARVAMLPESADLCKSLNVPYIYARRETSPDDLRYMKDAVGILTCNGGVSSHAALIARSWGKIGVVGTGGEFMSPGSIMYDGVEIRDNDTVTLDADAGEVLV